VLSLTTLFCNKKGHENNPIQSICTKVHCKLSVLNCIRCLFEDHLKCNAHMICLSDLLSNNVDSLRNLYASESVYRAA
jgi:hypothetical protein